MNYTGGVFDDPLAEQELNHIVSLTGWGYDPKTGAREGGGRSPDGADNRRVFF